jgi:pimeloyl-ACP methyl ester carboxylesterase
MQTAPVAAARNTNIATENWIKQKMQENSFLTLNSSGFSKIYYQEWGQGNSRTLVCVHGLTGSSDDFKFVGESLPHQGFHVVALDLPGRGRSDFLLNPDDYNYTQYLCDLSVFLAQIGCSSPSSCDWLGVSLGGLLGIRLASFPASPIRNLILSDVGPTVPEFTLDMIRGYLSLSPVFETLDGVIGAFKQTIGTTFYRGPMTEAQWAYYAATHVRQREDGFYIRNFDPGIAVMFEKEPIGKIDLWPCWKNITQPVLALRGELSALFPVSVANEMQETKKGDSMDLVTIKDCGHVPSLYRDEQISILVDWLKKQAA